MHFCARSPPARRPGCGAPQPARTPQPRRSHWLSQERGQPAIRSDRAADYPCLGILIFPVARTLIISNAATRPTNLTPLINMPEMTKALTGGSVARRVAGTSPAMTVGAGHDDGGT